MKYRHVFRDARGKTRLNYVRPEELNSALKELMGQEAVVSVTITYISGEVRTVRKESDQ